MIRIAAAIASGVLVSLAFPSADVGVLAWVALVPLLLALRGLSSGRAAGLGLLFGGVAGFGIFGWLFALPYFGWVHFAALALYTSLYPACWCAGVAALGRRRDAGWSFVTVPALWVGLDVLRGHAGFLALPWATLGQSQHADVAVLQIAALGGEAAVTFLVVMANVAVASLIVHRAALLRSRRGAWAALAVVALAHVGGAVALAQVDHEPRITMAALQPGIGLGERDSAAGRDAIWRRLEALTRDAAMARPNAPALIVWPETAVGDPRHDAVLAARLGALSTAVRTPIVVGAAETEKFASSMSAGTNAVTNAGMDTDMNIGIATTEREAWNSAYLVADGAVVGEPYRKRVLMPFGEYLPLRGTVAWPTALVPAVVDGRAGEGDAAFEIATASGPLRIATTICWESEFADLARQSVVAGARLVVQLTNDAWFGDTRAAAQHNMASVLRAVENRVPVVLASNTGPSQVIDSHGRVQARVEGFGTRGVAIATVGIGAAGTLFSRIGDGFSFACIAVATLGFGAGLRRLLTSGSPGPTPSPTFAKETI